MFIHKIFHVHTGLEEAKSKLANVHSYRRHLEGVRKIVVTGEGSAQIDCTTPNGFRAHAVLTELPTAEENQVLFRSTAGNVEVAGLLEFFPVKPDCTEVQFTLEYAIKSPVRSVLDAVTASMERFLNRQIRNLQAALDGTPNVAALPASTQDGDRFLGQVPHFAH